MQEPVDFTLQAFLIGRGYEHQIATSAMVVECQQQLIQELQKITVVEVKTIDSMKIKIQSLLDTYPQFKQKTEILLQRNHDRFINARNYTRQNACQAILMKLGPPKRRCKPSVKSLTVLSEWGAQNLYPTRE